MTFLQIENLTTKFGDNVILDALTLNIAAGSLVSVLGPSGCGKSTLLRSIAGFIPPVTGTIRIAGKLMSVSSVLVPPEKRNIGYVPQEGALFPHLSVEKNIAFGLPRNSENKSRIEEILKVVDLVGFEKRMPSELSGGQQFRVAIARALAPKPSLVLLDEPFASLDAELREDLRVEVKHILHQTNATAILVTHDREEALVMSDYVAAMKNGKIIQFGTPHEVYNSPVQADVALSTGDSIIIPGVKDKDGKIFTLFDESFPKDGTHGEVVIRPEEITIVKDSLNFNARVKDIEYFGHDALVYLEMKNSTVSDICARVTAPIEFKVGEEVMAKNIAQLRWFQKS
jgi:iron(III) transport system ATP-binding protein